MRITTFAVAAMAALAPLAAGAQMLTIGVRGRSDFMDPQGSTFGNLTEAMTHRFETLVWSGGRPATSRTAGVSWSG
jgi:peptide/nickel transport system substrate-binding protein